MSGGADDAVERRRRHWRVTRVVTAALLAVWALVTFGVAYEARAFDFSFFGWPFSFWVAAQGALLVYLALVGGYAWVMARVDEAHDLDEID